MEGRYIPYGGNASDGDSLGNPDFNYSRYGMDNSRAAASYRNDPTVKTLRLLAEVWLSMPIALFGIVGNLISLVVLCYHRRLKKLQSIIAQLQALAVVDTLILISILLLRSFRYIGPEWYVGLHTVMFPYLLPTAYFLRLLSVWLTVLITVDRCIAVWYPLDARSLCTTKRTYITMAIITALTFAFSLPRYFEYTLREYPGGHVGFVSTPLLDSRAYNIVYRIVLFISLQYLIPTLALVCLNAGVIVALRRSDTYRQSVTGHAPVVPARSYPAVTSQPPEGAVMTSQSTRSITVVVAVIVAICIVVHVVAMTAHIVATVQINLDVPRRVEVARRHLSQASNVLVTINSAVNFIVYCMISRKFREVLLRHCVCCCLVARRRSTSSSLTPPPTAAAAGAVASTRPCCQPLVACCGRDAAPVPGRRHSDADGSKRSTTGTNPTSELAPRSMRTHPQQQLELHQLLEIRS